MEDAAGGLTTKIDEPPRRFDRMEESPAQRLRDATKLKGKVHGDCVAACIEGRLDDALSERILERANGGREARVKRDTESTLTLGFGRSRCGSRNLARVSEFGCLVSTACGRSHGRRLEERSSANPR